jgi:hypothetical protein
MGITFNMKHRDTEIRPGLESRCLFSVGLWVITTLHEKDYDREAACLCSDISSPEPHNGIHWTLLLEDLRQKLLGEFEFDPPKGWCAGNAVDLYLSGALFESRPGHLLHWLNIFVRFHCPFRKVSV